MSKAQHQETPSLIQVVVSNIFYFHPYLGKIPIFTNIFQMGWNHKLDLKLENIWVHFRSLSNIQAAQWNNYKKDYAICSPKLWSDIPQRQMNNCIGSLFLYQPSKTQTTRQLNKRKVPIQDFNQ